MIPTKLFKVHDAKITKNNGHNRMEILVGQEMDFKNGEIPI